MASLQEEAQLL